MSKKKRSTHCGGTSVKGEHLGHDRLGSSVGGRRGFRLQKAAFTKLWLIEGSGIEEPNSIVQV